MHEVVAATDRKPFVYELKRLGFFKAYSDRDPLTYKRREGNRTVIVQLWRDGQHRASNGIHRVLNTAGLEGCRESTTPTDFVTLDGMRSAITHESTRSDHPTDPGLLSERAARA